MRGRFIRTVATLLICELACSHLGFAETPASTTVTPNVPTVESAKTDEAANGVTIGSNSDTSPRQSSKKPLRVTVSTFALPEQRAEFDKATLSVLHQVFPDRNVIIDYLSVEGNIRAVSSGKADLFISSAGAARRLTAAGARILATTVAPGLKDPNHNEGTAIVVRRDDRRTLPELRHTILAANLSTGFSGYQIAMGEIARLGFNPDRFFARSIFFDRSASMEEVARTVSEERADVGFLRLCAFEDLARSHPEVTATLRVLPPPTDAEGKVSCRHSTRLYPAQSISVMPTMSPEESRQLLVALLTMPASPDGRAWSVATDYHTVDILLKDLKVGPYAYLRERTLKSFLEDYWPILAMLLVAGVGVLLHLWRLKVLITRREQELALANAREQAQTRRIDALQRAGAVGQLSTLIAHELHQPLAAVRLFADGLARQAKAENAPPEKVARIASRISDEVGRASEIVNRVRDFAHQREPVFTQIRVMDLVRHIEETYPKLFECVTVTVDPALQEATLRGSLLELELAVVNLLRNAREATKAQPDGRITLSLFREGKTLVLAVTDNGPGLSDERLEELSLPVTSSKPNGLGLGLTIVRHLVERHEGLLSFSHASTHAPALDSTAASEKPSRGLRAEIHLPLSTRSESQATAPTATALPTPISATKSVPTSSQGTV